MLSYVTLLTNEISGHIYSWKINRSCKHAERAVKLEKMCDKTEGDEQDAFFCLEALKDVYRCLQHSKEVFRFSLLKIRFFSLCQYMDMIHLCMGYFCSLRLAILTLRLGCEKGGAVEK